MACENSKGKDYLTKEEIKGLLNAPDLKINIGKRNKANTGISQTEITRLKISDIDFENMTVFISGKKKRTVKIDAKTCDCINLYLKNIRHRDETDNLFFTLAGKPITCKALKYLLFTSSMKGKLTRLAEWKMLQNAYYKRNKEGGDSICGMNLQKNN